MRIVILVIFGVLAVGGFIAMSIDAPGRKEIQQLSFSNGELPKLNDGTFIGEYTGTKSHLRDTKVEVRISGGEISDVKIVKGALDKEGKPLVMTKGKSIQTIFDDVQKKRTLQVDVISGATLTSKTHLKALENALEQAWVKE
ncbi:MAG TPA: FMN-binding protein [Chitinispirillaceae bacterium]|nr:FMN-binding protein [Chitinispirillaceae bacterium]